MGEHETQNREFRILKQNSGRLQNQFICIQIFSCQPELQVSASNDTSQSPLTDASVSYSTDPRGRKIVLLHEWLSLRTRRVTGIAFFLFFPHFFFKFLNIQHSDMMFFFQKTDHCLLCTCVLYFCCMVSSLRLIPKSFHSTIS